MLFHDMMLQMGTPFDPFPFSYSDFASTSGLNLVPSNMSIISNNLYVTTTTSGTGNVWLSSLRNFQKNFTLSWRFECSGGTGADGFCIQWHTANNVNGGGGSDVGRILSTSCIHAVVFDTYTSSAVNHYKNNVLSAGPLTAALNFRQNVYYWLDYNHSAQTCQVRYSTSATKPGSANHTLSSFLFDSTSYYLGVGASTGAVTDNHILKTMALV